MIPMGTNLVVTPIKMEKVTEFGIVVADVNKRREDNASLAAQVVSLGPLAFQEEKWHSDKISPRLPEPGDKVLIKKYSGIDVKLGEGEAIRVISDTDVLCIVGDETIRKLTKWSIN